MPRVRRRSHLRSQPKLSGERMTVYLETGCDYRFLDDNLGATIAESDAREAWRLHGAEITAAFIAEHPGRRPAGWWQFEAPALRQRRDGQAHIGDHGVTWRGVPIGLDYHPECESELQFLHRHELLTPAEKELLS